MSPWHEAPKQVLDICLLRDVLDGNLRDGKQTLTSLNR